MIQRRLTWGPRQRRKNDHLACRILLHLPPCFEVALLGARART